MKNLKKIILGCSCILFLSVSNVVFATTGKVTGKTVRIRESADASSNIVTNAYRNDTVEVLSTEGDWYKVKYEDKTGYMSKEFLEVKEEVKEEVQEKVQEEAPVTTPSENNTQQSNQTNLNTEEKNKIVKETNLKLLPNFSSTNLGVVSVDTEIKIEKEINNWLQITAGSNTGWVLKNYVSENQVLNSEVTEPENNQPETAQPEVAEPEATTPETTTPTNTEPEVTELEVKTENEPENKEEPKEQGTTNKIAYISTDTARVRATAGGKILGNLDLNDEITIIGEDGEWYKITCSEYSEGYVSKKLVSTERVSSRSSNGTRTQENAEQTTQVDNTTPEPTSAPESAPEPAPAPETTPTPAPAPEPAPEPAPAPSTSNKGEEIVAYAKSFLGCRYISGGTSPNGFDCSGFTQYVYSHFGYSIARVASAQNSNGTAVDRSNLQPGDIVVFLDYGKSKIGHVGIYIGNGNFVHAANPSRGVVIDNLNSNSYYNQRYVSARRIV